MVVLALLAGTALFQSGVLFGTLPGLIGTGYGLVALAKLGLPRRQQAPGHAPSAPLTRRCAGLG